MNRENWELGKLKREFIRAVGRGEGKETVREIMGRLGIEVQTLGRWARQRVFRRELERELAGRRLERDLNLVMGGVRAAAAVAEGKVDAINLRLVGAGQRVRIGEVAGGCEGPTRRRSFRHPNAARLMAEIAAEEAEARARALEEGAGPRMDTNGQE